MHASVLALLLAASAVLPRGDTREMTLTLAHPPAAGQSVWLSVTLGVIPRGTRVLVLSKDGALLSVLSPFAIPRGQPAGAYTVALPAGTVVHGEADVRLAIEVSPNQTRAPTAEEVTGAKLIAVDTGR